MHTFFWDRTKISASVDLDKPCPFPCFSNQTGKDLTEAHAFRDADADAGHEGGVLGFKVWGLVPFALRVPKTWTCLRYGGLGLQGWQSRLMGFMVRPERGLPRFSWLLRLPQVCGLGFRVVLSWSSSRFGSETFETPSDLDRQTQKPDRGMP